jgi:hypothetical protein
MIGSSTGLVVGVVVVVVVVVAVLVAVVVGGLVPVAAGAWGQRLPTAAAGRERRRPAMVDDAGVPTGPPARAAVVVAVGLEADTGSGAWMPGVDPGSAW